MASVCSLLWYNSSGTCCFLSKAQKLPTHLSCYYTNTLFTVSIHNCHSIIKYLKYSSQLIYHTESSFLWLRLKHGSNNCSHEPTKNLTHYPCHCMHGPHTNVHMKVYTTAHKVGTPPLIGTRVFVGNNKICSIRDDIHTTLPNMVAGVCEKGEWLCFQSQG